MDRPGRQILDKVRGIQTWILSLPKRAETIRLQIEEHLEEFSEIQLCDIYDGIDECIIEFERLNLDELKAIQDLLQEQVETHISRQIEHIKHLSLSRKYDEDIPEEIEMSAYFDSEGKERQLKNPRKKRKVS